MFAMDIALYIALAFVGIGLVISIVNGFAGPWLRSAPEPTSYPLISVLIPARNEEHNIGACLQSLVLQRYPHLEILALDDNSDDHTPDIIRKYAAQDDRVRLLNGRALPKGWTGKTWACAQLSDAANGEILIFTDADNTCAPFAVQHTVGWMQKLNVQSLSAFPQQITGSLSEKLIIPLIDLIVYAGLPLWCTYYLRSPALAAGNGQWLAFTKKAYQAIEGHSAVRREVVEDVEITRRLRNHGFRSITMIGADVVFGRMYRSTREVWHGLSKNFYGLFRYKAASFFLMLSLSLVAYVLPYALIAFPSYAALAAIAIGLNTLLRLHMAIRFRHSLITSVVLHPVAVCFAIAIALNSFKSVIRGSVTWKGRSIPIDVHKQSSQEK